MRLAGQCVAAGCTGLPTSGRVSIIVHMPSTIAVHMLPSLTKPAALRDGIAVVIDVLRASTTITHALAAGAQAVVPCLNVEEARSGGAGHQGRVILGGERDGVLIDGFDLDNSPLRYTPETVAGATVFFTTTNGTKALHFARMARRIYLGGFCNLNAILARLVECDRPIHLLCAGTDGAVTLEDVLFAGAVVTGLAAAQDRPIEEFDDETQLACTLFESCRHSRAELAAVLRKSQGGRNLLARGFEADIRRAALWDLFTTVPEYDSGTGIIQAASDPVKINTLWITPP